LRRPTSRIAKGTNSLMAEPQFLASMHDEFELLDLNADWVHLSISGLSRGWIWRNRVDVPEEINDTDIPTTPGLAPVANLFHVGREDSPEIGNRCAIKT